MSVVACHNHGTLRAPTRAPFGVRLEPSGRGGGSPVHDARACGERNDPVQRIHAARVDLGGLR